MIGRLSRIILLVCVSVLSVWAVVAAVWGGPGESVSAHVRDYSHIWPAIPFALGVLLGHWLGLSFEMSRPARIALALVAAGQALAAALVAPSHYAVWLCLIGGVLAGATLWRMGPPQPRDGRSAWKSR